ncbi:MAG: GNAT family N-acetyltransferase [Cyanobacteria bacterium J06635_1]
MALQFQPAQLSDLETLLAMMADFYQGQQLPFSALDAQVAIAGLIQAPHYGGIWLIQLHTQTIGYLALCIGYSLEYKGPDAFLDEIYIQPTYRSQGIGTQAIAFAENICRERNIHALHLEVEHHNPKAQRFYEKTGYVLHNRALMTKWL